MCRWHPFLKVARSRSFEVGRHRVTFAARPSWRSCKGRISHVPARLDAPRAWLRDICRSSRGDRLILRRYNGGFIGEGVLLSIQGGTQVWLARPDKHWSLPVFDEN